VQDEDVICNCIPNCHANHRQKWIKIAENNDGKWNNLPFHTCLNTKITNSTEGRVVNVRAANIEVLHGTQKGYLIKFKLSK